MKGHIQYNSYKKVMSDGAWEREGENGGAFSSNLGSKLQQICSSLNRSKGIVFTQFLTLKKKKKVMIMVSGVGRSMIPSNQIT